jgi:F-type H+-transporting ATPase subunit epsilon
VALHLQIVTPRGSVVSTDTDEVVLPGKLGEFGVMEGHIPFLSALKPGVLGYKVGTEWKRLAIGSGFAEVGASQKVLVLTDLHAFPQQIDSAEVAGELTELEAELKSWTGEITAEHQELLDKAAWAQARLDVKNEK